MSTQLNGQINYDVPVLKLNQYAQAEVDNPPGTGGGIEVKQFDPGDVLQTAFVKFYEAAKKWTCGRGAIVHEIARKHVHTQLVLNTLWTVTHTLETQDVLVQVYDPANILLTPSSITLTSPTQIDITFAAPATGKVVVIG